MNSTVVMYAQILSCFILKAESKKHDNLFKPPRDQQTPWTNSEPQMIF